MKGNIKRDEAKRYKKEKNYAKLSKLVMLLEWCALYDFEDMNGVE